MKSLSEIITWLSDLQPDDDQMIKLHENELSDTIHYLTEYREMLENVENEPLEYEELQQMVGKPVWIESQSIGKKHCGWVVIKQHLIEGAIVTDPRLFYAANYGKTWFAYKKERKVENGHIFSGCNK